MEKIGRFVFIFVFVALLASCEYWNKDLLGYLEYWSSTVQMGRIEEDLAGASSQVNNSGVKTIPVDSTPIITGYLINPQGYPIVTDIGSSSDSNVAIKVSDATVKNIVKPVTHDPTMLKVRLDAADSSLEHTTFTVSMVAIRKDTMTSAGSPMSVTFQYNTPPVAPVRMKKTEDGNFQPVSAGEKWLSDTDGFLYWRWTHGTDGGSSPNDIKWFSIDGQRKLPSECQSQTQGQSGIYCYQTGNRSVSLSAVDSEGIFSPSITSGQVAPVGTDVTPPGSVTNLTATYNASKTITVTWTDPVDGDLQDIEVTLSGGTTTPYSKTVSKGTEKVEFTNILNNGTSYTVTVVARDTSGNSSTDTTTVIADNTPPKEIQTLTPQLNGDGSSVTLSWTYDTSDPDYVNGSIEKTIISWNGERHEISGSNTTSLSISSLSSDTEYTFTVKLRDKNGNENTGKTTTLKWYIVTFDANGGNAPPPIKFVEDGKTCNLPNAGGITRTNFTLTGWKDLQSSQFYQAGASFTPTADTTLVAQWKHKYEDQMSDNPISNFSQFTKGTKIFYKTSEGNYGYLEIESASASRIDFFWHTLGVNDPGQDKNNFQKNWGFDLDGGPGDDDLKDFGLDNGDIFQPYNGAKFYKIP